MIFKLSNDEIIEICIEGKIIIGKVLQIKDKQLLLSINQDKEYFYLPDLNKCTWIRKVISSVAPEQSDFNFSERVLDKNKVIDSETQKLNQKFSQDKEIQKVSQFLKQPLIPRKA